jgi:hypothetical protein
MKPDQESEQRESYLNEDMKVDIEEEKNKYVFKLA